MRKIWVAALASVVLAACGSTVSGDGGGDAGAGGGGSGGSGGAGGTGGSSGEGGSGGDVARPVVDIAWEAATASLPGAIDHQVSFAIASETFAHVYLLGGVKDRSEFHRESWYAAVGADGTLGTWTETTAMPAAVGGHAVAVVGNRVILIGGRDRTLANLDIVHVGAVAADGTIGAWEAGPTLPGGRFHSVAVVNGRWLYVIGGIETGAAIDSVLRIELKDDGGFGAWQEAGKLPAPRSHHAALVHDGALYVLGGLSGDPMRSSSETHADVWRAPLGSDGSLGAWETLASLPNRTSAMAAAAIGGSIFVVGGIEGSAYYSEHVRRAEIQADGSIAAWSEASDLPVGRAHVHQLPIVGERVFSLGGSTRNGSIETVVVGTLVE
jgi:hypothetical protein